MTHHQDPWRPDWVLPLPGLEELSAPIEARHELEQWLLAFMRKEHDYGYQRRTLRMSGRRIEEVALNTPNGVSLPRLWIVSEEAGLRLFVAGRKEPADLEIDIWVNGVAAAAESVGRRIGVKWIAIASQKQERPHEMVGLRLTSESGSANLTIRALDQGVLEDAPSVRVQFTRVACMATNSSLEAGAS